jgi:hypothetical protein
VHEYANTFSNIDRFLRLRGFSLFDLSTVRYSRAALPAPFASRILAHTVSGQVNCGKAVYFRDLGHHMYERTFGIVPAKERLLKLCCLFVLYGLDDCAAELLVASEALKTLPQRAALLDGLTPQSFDAPDYETYVARFNANPSAWLPSNRRPPIASDTTARALHARVAALKRRNRELKAEMERRSAESSATAAALNAHVAGLKDRSRQLKEETVRIRQQRRTSRARDQKAVTGWWKRRFPGWLAWLRRGFG